MFVLPQKQKERKQMERMEKEKQNPVRNEEVVTTVCSIAQTTADEKLIKYIYSFHSTGKQ